MNLVQWQRCEGALIFLCMVLGLIWAGMPISLWLALPVFFAPDLSFLAYLAGAVWGARIYNLVHIYAFGAVVALLGLWLEQDAFLLAGLLWIGHSGFDRMLGYGLKSPLGFHQTHLGRIGRDRDDDPRRAADPKETSKSP